MNELIEELWMKYVLAPSMLLRNFDQDQFAKAIQIACKAQANACLRESDKFKTPLDIKIRDSERESIKNAEIERCDYE